jgi:integrase
MWLEKNLYKLNGEYWVRLQSSIVKNKRQLEYSLPGELTPLIDRYLAEIRPLLIDADGNDAVWGHGNGGMYTYRSIETMIFRQTGRRFGKAFGPHLFRHAFASELARHDPHNPGLAAVILGISEGVVHEHYRRARQADAAVKFQASLRQDRARWRLRLKA